MLETNLVVMGHITGAFGVQGWIKIHADTMAPHSLFAYPVWYLGQFSRTWRAYQFVAGQVHRHVPIAQIETITNRDEALQLQGLLIAIPRTQLPKAEDEEYYWADLVGMSVCNQHGEALGIIEKLVSSPAHDILVVQQGAFRRLIPFVSAIVTQVDQSCRSVTVLWEKDY